MNMTDIAQTEVTRSASKMVLPIVFAVALAHFLNDLIQACLPAIYPLLKTNSVHDKIDNSLK